MSIIKTVVAVLIILILLVGITLFIELGTKIEWATYFGMPLVILTGSVGLAFITKKFEAIIGGVVISALWSVLCGTAYSILNNL